MGLLLQAQQQQPAPFKGTVLTWPKYARVYLKGPGEWGVPKLVKFPQRDAAGGVFASLQVWGPHFPPAWPFF